MLMILSVQCYSAVTIDRTRLILVQNQPGEVVLRNNSEVVKIVSILVTGLCCVIRSENQTAYN